MQPDAARVEDVKLWLTRASQDLRRVEVLLAASPPDFEDALFHCQQAAEKAFKASSHGTMFPFGEFTNSTQSADNARTSIPPWPIWSTGLTG